MPHRPRDRTYWILVKELAWTDFKVRYIQTRLGLLWAIIKPFVTFAVLYVVFSILTNFRGPEYVLMLLLGVIWWNFFADATVSSIEYLIGKRLIMRNLPVPVSAIVLSACIQAFIIFFIDLLMYLGVSLMIGVLPALWQYGAVVWLVAAFFVLTLGTSFVVAAVGFVWRDIAQVWEVLLRLGFFLAPVIYPVSAVPERILGWYLLNPLARFIHEARELLISGTSSFRALLLVTLISIFVLLVGQFVSSALAGRIQEAA